MGCWDELCVVCGVSGGGPSELLSSYTLDTDSRKIASEIAVSDSTHTLSEDSLFAIVRDALEATITPRSLSRASWLPDGVGSGVEVGPSFDFYNTWRCVAVGYFDRESGEGRAPVRDGLVPDGKHVRVRQVIDEYAGDFSRVVCTVATPSGREVEVQREKLSMCAVVHGIQPNIRTCERCYYYLRNWVDTDSLPPPASNRKLSFAGELYETLNSRKMLRGT